MATFFGLSSTSRLFLNFKYQMGSALKQSDELAAFGVVYKTDRWVVKLQAQGFDEKREEYQERVKYEGEVAKRLRDCPNIIYTDHHFFDHQTNWHILVQKNGGENLSRLYLKDPSKRATIHDIQRIAFQALKALAYMHEQKIAHFDIKPRNLVEDEKKDLKVVDFGLSLSLWKCEFVTGIRASFYFRPPENFLGQKTSYPCDIWSLGASLFRLYTKKIFLKAPYTGEDKDLPGVFLIFKKRLGIQQFPCFQRVIQEKVRGNTPDLECNRYRDVIEKVGKQHREQVAGLLLLLSNMLQFDPTKRKTAKELLGDHFNYECIHL